MSWKDSKKYRQDFWPGTSQVTRLLKELMPDYVQVDEMTINHLVKFTDEYARRIIFHRGETAVLNKGNWQEFLIKDYLYLLFFMSNTEVGDIRNNFFTLLDSAHRAGNSKMRRQQSVNMLSMILDLASTLHSWYEHMEYNEHTQDMVYNLRNAIEKELVPSIAQLRTAKHLLIQPKDKIPLEVLTEKKFSKLENQLKLNVSTPQVSVISMHADMLSVLNETFNRLFFITEHLSNTAGKVLEKVLAERKDNKAHIALFIAFLRLFKKAQGELNQLTRKHLEFYYRSVLRQNPDDTLPDNAYISLGLAKSVENMSLEKGTGFSAGKDVNGKDLVYRSAESVQLTQVQIRQIHTLFVSRNPLNYSGLSGSNITDIFYRSHSPLPEEASGWALFGEDQFFKGSANKTMENAAVGFIIASEALHMTEGHRDIRIDLECTLDSYLAMKEMVGEIARNANEKEDSCFTRIFLTAFDFYISLDGHEVQMERFAIKDQPGKQTLSIHFELGPTEGKLMEPAPSKEKPPVPVTKPYVKLLLRPESHIFVHPLIQSLHLANIHIHTSAKGIKELALYNNFGQINPSVPFPLFGISPQIGSYFLVGSPEIFSKHLDDLTIRIQWFQLPHNENGWAGYFSGYDANIKNSDYQVDLSYLKNGSWYPAYSRITCQLFEEETLHGIKTRRLSGETFFSEINLSQLSFVPSEQTVINPYNHKTRDGYLKMEFSGPDFAFGHADYARKLSATVLHNLKPSSDGQEAVPEPEPPVSPLVESIEASYRASVSAYDDDKPTYEIDLYQVSPFGYKTMPLKSVHATATLLEQFEDEGHLHLGLDAYPDNGYLSLFFHLMEGRIEDFLRDIPEPRWQYMADNAWHDFQVISDGTHGFIQSGIIQMRIPSQIRKNNTLLDENLFWIKVSVHQDSQVAADVNGIYTNAVKVQWDENASKDHLNEPLPAYTIVKLKDKVPGIKTVVQPLASFGAKKVESTPFFYQRVSERLRHKNRAVNVWDYERLVLDRFPLLHRVKCFTANTLYHEVTEDKQKYIVPPGSVKIVVIPDINSPQVRNILRPKVSISVLASIQRYLKSITSPFTEIEVMNPFYEWVRVIARVKLKDGLIDEGFYLRQLNDELRGYLTPWIWNPDTNAPFGNSVFESRIMSFVESRPYIDFVTGFSIIKTWNDDQVMDMSDSARKGSREELKPVYPWSILVSANSHDLAVIRKETYIRPEARGIDNMLLGSDFIISE